jgi:hypothetical protein
LKNNEKTENLLLMALLKADDGNEISDLLREEINWNHILDKAEEHRVIPLIFQKLKTNFADKIPEYVFDEVQTRALKITRLNFGRAAQLIKLTESLQKHDIPVIAYKGIALAAAAYGDVGLRQFTDIDLLIRRNDFSHVKRVFSQVNCLPAWNLNEKQEKAVLKYYYEYPFFYGENKTLIEVHWRFTEPFFAFDFGVEKIFERVQTINIFGKSIPTLSVEDSLIILSAHGSKHFWKRLSWVCDIAKLVENTEIDWNLTVRRAKDAGSLRMLQLGLSLAKEILNTGLPEAINSQLSSDTRVLALAETIKNNLFARNDAFSKWTEMANLHLRMRERKRDKLKYSRRLLTTKLIDSLFLPMGRPQ